MVWTAAGVLCLLVGAMHTLAWMIGRWESPEHLNAPMQIAETNGFRILWARRPAANANFIVVLVHGTPGRAGVWREQFTSPFPGADLIAYDRPGFGESRPAERRPHLAQQVTALTNLMARVTTNRVLVAGHSYGGPIALLAAIRHPDRIAGALLISADVAPELEKVLAIQRVADSPFVSWLLPRSLRQCNREVLAAPSDLTELQALLPDLSVPVVMLHGGQDRLVPVENVAWLERQLAAVGKAGLLTSIIVPEFNHFIPWERPEAVAEALDRLRPEDQNW